MWGGGAEAALSWCTRIQHPNQKQGILNRTTAVPIRYRYQYRRRNGFLLKFSNNGRKFHLAEGAREYLLAANNIKLHIIKR